MKNQLLFIAVLLCACLAGGCKDDTPSAPDSVYMYSTSGTVEAAAGTHSVTIFTTCGWEATGNDWITVEPISGGEKGIFAVHLSFGANNTGSTRTGQVVFKAGTYSETYTLTQAAQ
jgi:hypothetical protein